MYRQGGVCGCGKSYGKYGHESNSQCNVACIGNFELFQCGSHEHMSVFEISWYQTMRDSEFYYTTEKQVNANSQQFKLQLQRGFTYNPKANYKIW